MAEQAKPAPAIPPGLHSSRVAPIQDLFQQWTPLLHPTKSPEEVFQEKYKEAQARFDTAAASACGQSDTARLDDVLSCINYLKELKADREAHKEDEESEYQELYWEQQEALGLAFLDLLGPELGDRLCNKWRQRTQLPMNNPAQPDAAAGSSSQLTTNSYVTPNSSPILQSFHPPNPRAHNESAPILPTPDRTRDQETYRNCRPLDENQPSSKAQQKRPASSPQGTAPRPAKHPRSNTLQPRGPLTGDRVIDYDDVYQDGNAEKKYVIAKHKGFWYILECKKHKLGFMKNNPIHGARRHLTAETHGFLSVKYDETIRLLGTRVLNCDEAKAKRNNEVAQRPTYAQYGRPLSIVSAGSVHGNSEGPQTRSTQFLTGIDPQPGEVYTTFWKKTKRFFAILVLPWGSFRQFGWDMNLMENTGLLKKNIPTCYDYNPVTETVEWTAHYRPGGKYHHKRKYPVMYIDAPVFPWECAIGWVAVNEFHPYDPNDESIPHKDKVDEFILRIKDRDRLRSGEEDSGEAEHQDVDSAPGDVADQQQSTEVEQPPLGSCMRLAIEIPDDDSDTEGPSRMDEDTDWTPGETRVKTEPMNEQAPDAATAHTTNSVGSETANQLNGLDYTPTIPNPVPALDTNGVLHPAAPNTPAVENPGIPSSDFIYDHLQGRWRPNPQSDRTIPAEAPSPRAPEAVMTPVDQNLPSAATGPGPSAPLARMDGHADIETPALPRWYAYQEQIYTASTTADVAENSSLAGPAQTATEVARDREIDIRNAAARRSNWRHPFVSDDTD